MLPTSELQLGDSFKVVLKIKRQQETNRTEEQVINTFLFFLKRDFYRSLLITSECR